MLYTLASGAIWLLFLLIIMLPNILEKIEIVWTPKLFKFFSMRCGVELFSKSIYLCDRKIRKIVSIINIVYVTFSFVNFKSLYFV